jgi:hypothetical protein
VRISRLGFRLIGIRPSAARKPCRQRVADPQIEPTASGTAAFHPTVAAC